MKPIALLIFIVCVFSLQGQSLEPNSTGVFTYIPNAPLNTKTVRVFYHIPDGDISTMPIVFSFHGASRNANDYRDYWIDMANSNGFMVFAPEFSSSEFPTGDQYQLANIFVDGDNPSSATRNPENEWTISIIDPLFDYIKNILSGTQVSYNAWGHSGGSQFLHRFIMFLPDSKLNIAICSNAGWYTVPEYSINFPYGLNLSELPNEDLRSAFSRRVIVHLGQNDTNPNSPGLRHNEVVDNQQGLHRFERGLYFFNTSSSKAQSFATAFNWEKKEVPNVGHNAQQMANDALPYILENSLSIPKIQLESIQIYPNPVSERLFIKDLEHQISRVDLYNFQGQLVYSTTAYDKGIKISRFTKGIYFLRIVNQHKSFTKKIIIE